MLMSVLPMTIEGSHLRDLNELQNKSFRLTLVLVIIATQMALFAGDLAIRPLPSNVIAAGLDLTFFCAIIYFLFARYPQAARYLFVSGLIIGNFLAYSYFPSSVFLYFFGFICLFAGMHLPKPFAVSLTLISSLLVLAIGSNESWATIFSVLFLLWFALLANFVAYRNLIEALQMAWNYQSYAIVQMEEARDHRAELMKLTKALQETRDELGLANIQLRHAHSAAEEAGRLKAQFAANVSHEFRTPINLIVGFSEMIVSNPQAYREPLPRAYWSDLQTICECAKHLQSLINDVLDISQIEAGYMAMVKEFVDPRQVILDATNLAREMIEGAGLVFNLIMPDHLPSMWIDRTRIRQVLLNLLSNAVRFTNQGSITLQVKVDAKQLTMSITDTGTGIRQEDISHIFDAYYQAEESDFRRSRGSGLGLTLSKQFVSS